MESRITKALTAPQTVLTTQDLALLWGESNPVNLNAKIGYYTRQGALRRIPRGVFAKRDYDPKELAARIYTPSYLSFETVLREAGMIFQHYETIFVAAPYSLTRVLDSHTITFRKLKDQVLYNSSGVDNRGTYSIATPERAFLDTLYLFPAYYFDNLNGINWELCEQLVGLYNNAQLKKRLASYREDHVE